jgi:GR25 family glycosyltransferase involved in LPS biosynthesis
MMGVLWEVSLGDFLLVTVFLGGGGAFLTGRALALTWRPFAQLVGYILLLTAATRFIHFALFGGTLLSIQFYCVDFIVLMAFAAFGYRLARVRQMVGQYSWLYRRTGLVTWRRRNP